MTKYSIDKATLIDWLGDGLELAVLDIRPTEDVGYASPLFATNLPAARLEAELDHFVPRRAVRTVLVDGGDSAAEAATTRLAQVGWTDIHFLEGGIPASGGRRRGSTSDLRYSGRSLRNEGARGTTDTGDCRCRTQGTAR
jgi:hypothetical protein